MKLFLKKRPRATVDYLEEEIKKRGLEKENAFSKKVANRSF